ncbi:hypothetical protein CYMTET_42148 [Cymbomonas tetramitiformis]|uniref:Uncharacterized protein n=1 Tax=Cymbomonas tetramitiformis TaxID=36881 RepID=A0AAE0C4R4_9CHLO|nr:hypothetical protein CYMTET_42148 [Cymbomonas tetramitiformis]
MAAAESGHNPAKDATILPFIRERVRTDISNFRKAWRLVRWSKEGKRWRLALADHHPYSAHEKAKEGIFIDVFRDKNKLEALKTAGIEPLDLPEIKEEVEDNEAMRAFCFAQCDAPQEDAPSTGNKKEDKEVVVYCKPTEDDETIPLDVDNYFTGAGNLHAKVLLLAGIVLGSKLDSKNTHGHLEECEETIKLPPEFLTLEVRKNSYPVPKAYISA